MDRRRPPDRLLQFGRAAIGESRPNPLFRKDHFMDDTIQKVEKTGVYTLVDGTPVRLKKGDVMPDGAEYRDAGAKRAMSARGAEKQRIAKATERENRARGAAPENRGQATGHTITNAATGESRTITQAEWKRDGTTLREQGFERVEDAPETA